MAGDRCYRGLQRYGTVILRDITGRELANRETKLINKRQKPRIASRNTHKPIAAPIKQIFKKAIDQA